MARLPVIALVGRPNVGKSTLFNRLTRTRDALVADLPGLTRDRIYGRVRLGPRPAIVVDTGGLTGEDEGLEGGMARQAWRAVEEADVVVLLVDARDGLTAGDELIAERLRRTGKPVVVAVNKAERLSPAVAAAEFHALGLGEPVAISAAHGQGVGVLLERALSLAPSAEEAQPSGEPERTEDTRRVRVAILGRPNVGKSTLVNRLVGEERVLASEVPGTTRDAVRIDFERDGEAFTLIDTAGVRRRARVKEAVEKFSVLKALQAMEQAQVVVLVLDAREGVTEQDATLLGHAIEAGRGVVVAVNKWDGLPPEQRARVRAEVERRLAFADFAPVRYISALHGSGLGELLAAVRQVADSAARRLPTPRLTRVLREAVTAHPPPPGRGRRRIKLRYAHQGGQNPPVIVIHGTQAERLPAAYRRYLAKRFREAFGLVGTPLRLELRSGENPYAARAARRR
ncbi:MAG TPA: ribosome biogenesis GTPase Der [Chromatiales bacterium]|nr:ribosome biogenesis GTPase Der [Chromatiales bacterium]